MDEFRALLAPHVAVRGGLSRLSDGSGIAPHLIGRWASDDPKKQVRPSPDNLKRIAPALGVPYEDLLRMVYLDQDATDVVDRDLATVTAVWPRLESGVRKAIRGFAEAGARGLIDVYFPALPPADVLALTPSS